MHSVKSQRAEPAVTLPPEVRSARRELERLLIRSAWSGDVDAALIAVQEALINAERHGDGLREVRARIAGEVLEVEVADCGRAFSADPYLHQSPDPMSERGRGLWLIGHLAAQIHVEAESEGSRVRLLFVPDSVAAALPEEPAGGSTNGALIDLSALPIPPIGELGEEIIAALGAAVVITDTHLTVCAVAGDVEGVLGMTRSSAIGQDGRTFAAEVKHRFVDPVDFEDRLFSSYAHLDEPCDDRFPMVGGGLLHRSSRPLLHEGGVVAHLGVYTRHRGAEAAGTDLGRELISHRQH
jgi:anti-sigma regulatory factor (Ser/Thr protein kinase)